MKSESARLFREADEANRSSTLPEEPDYERAQQLLMSITSEGLYGRAP